MASKTLFKSTHAPQAPQTDAVNEAGGIAYNLEDRQALAQLVSTGCFNNSFYASGEDQLDKVMELAGRVDTKFLAQVAVFSRERGYMKDAPALLCAILTTRGEEGRRYLKAIFGRVIDNGKMLRNFVQIMRSGRVGRRSLGTFPKGLVRSWLAGQTDERIFKSSVGNDPSMSDLIKMVHPKPETRSRSALYAYIMGKKPAFELLPDLVKQYEAFKKGEFVEGLDVPFEMLTALDLKDSQWKDIAMNMSWTQLRMNLNTLKRHNVFEDPGIVQDLTQRLADRDLVRRARVFPYQLLSAYLHADEDLPALLREALQDALDVSLENIPSIDGRVAVFPDHSGSMDMAATGSRGSATSKVTCRMVAALVAAAYLRKNPTCLVLPFATDVSHVRLNPRDSVVTNAQILARLPSGGTDCAAPLRHINRTGEHVDLAILASDNESWVQSSDQWGRTGVVNEWERIRRANPRARLVCLDIQPSITTQAPDRKDILNIGGFSDRVFDIIALFHRDELAAEHWVGEISKIEI